jgi:hypothetical protein
MSTGPPPLPSQTNSLLAVAILSLALGYWIGVGRSLGVTRGRGAAEAEEKSDAAAAPAVVPAVSEKKEEEENPKTVEEEEEEDSSDEDEDGPIAGLETIKPGFMEECKMVSLS